MGTVRVIFSRRHHIGSLALRTFLWSAWSHCGIIAGDQVIEAVFGKGVVITPLKDFQKQASKWTIIRIPAANPAAVTDWAKNRKASPTTRPACSASPCDAPGRIPQRGSVPNWWRPHSMQQELPCSAPMSGGSHRATYTYGRIDVVPSKKEDGDRAGVRAPFRPADPQNVPASHPKAAYRRPTV